jgi:hypothetical protein
MSERKIKLNATIIDEDPGDATASMIRGRMVAIDLAPVLGAGDWVLDFNDPIIAFGDAEITLALDATDDDELLWEDELEDA